MGKIQPVWRELAIAVPTFRRNAELIDLLRSIEVQEVQPGLVIVFDNSPDSVSEGTVRDFASACSFKLEYVPLQRNVGPAGSFSAAISALSLRLDEVQWMMCRGDDNAFKRTSEIAEMHKFSLKSWCRRPVAIGAAGVRYDAATGRSSRISAASLVDAEAVEVDSIPGSGSPTYYLPELVRQRLTFNSELFFGSEELELGLQLRRRGLLLLVNPQEAYRVLEAAGQLQLGERSYDLSRRVSDWRHYFSHRNRLVVAREFGTRTAVWHLSARSLAKALYLLCLGRSPMFAWAVMMGLRDGLRSRGEPHKKYVPR